MSAILKFEFQKRKQLRFSEVNYLNYTKKDPILHVTTTFSLKQGETRTSSGPIPHPLIVSAIESTLCQKWFLKTRFFVKKLKILISCSLDHTILFKFHQRMWFKFLSNNAWRDFILPMSAVATVAGKSFNRKFTAKIDFPLGYIYITIADDDIGSLKLLHTLFDKYFDHMLKKFKQNRMVQTVLNFELFEKT